MRTKITLTVLCVLSWFFVSAQKTKEVKKIVFDYDTQSFVGDKIFNDLKVNDWVSISIINLPENNNVTSTVTFTNRNLESLDNFKNYIAFSNNNTSGNIETTEMVKDNPLSEIKKNEAKQEELTKDFPDKKDEIGQIATSQSTEKFNEQVKEIFIDEPKTIRQRVDEILKKEYKINEDNIDTTLEIKLVEKFVKKYIQENPNGKLKNDADKAKEDYEWQKKLISYLQDNMRNKVKVRDSLINKMYDENQTLSKENKGLKVAKTTHNLPIVKIQNFDSTEFNITIEDKDKKKELITFPFRNNSGFKLDFSTGFILSGLYDEKYAIRQGTTQDNVQIKEEVPAKLNLGITLLAHAYFRSTNFLNPAITSGLSVNLGNQSLNYILGGSLLFGEDQRFIISSGMIVGKVKTLPNYYKTDKDISVDILPLSSQSPIVEKLKTSWFLGITYNLGISGKNKTVQLN